MNIQSKVPNEGYVSPTWLRNHLSISRSTLYSWIAQGRLKAPLRVGKRAVRFRAEDIAAFEAELLRTNEKVG